MWQTVVNQNVRLSTISGQFAMEMRELLSFWTVCHLYSSVSAARLLPIFVNCFKNNVIPATEKKYLSWIRRWIWDDRKERAYLYFCRRNLGESAVSLFLSRRLSFMSFRIKTVVLTLCLSGTSVAEGLFWMEINTWLLEMAKTHSGHLLHR